MARLEQFGGGAAGAGGTLAMRQYVDEPGQSRLKQPSALFGLGTGALAAGLWYTDLNTPFIGDDFWASHAITALPTGMFMAAFPKQAGQTTTESVKEALPTLLGGRSSTSGSGRQRQASGQSATVEVSGGSGGGDYNRSRRRANR